MTLDEWLAAASSVSRSRSGRADATVRRGHLACVSAAQQRQLAIWHEPRLLHLAFRPNAPVGRLHGVRPHRSRPIVAPDPAALVESAPDMLSHVASCLPRLDALVIWESALHAGLVTSRALQRIAWPGPAARRLARLASPHSHSILETVMLHRLAEAGIAAQQQVPLLGHRVDFLIGQRLVVQTDGFAFHQGAQREEDLRHDARLLIEDYRVLRFGPSQVLRDWSESLASIQGVLAQGA